MKTTHLIRIGLFRRITVACLIATVGIGGYALQEFREPPTAEEMDLAIKDTLGILSTNLSCPKDDVEVQEVAHALLPILQPDLANRERRAKQGVVDNDTASLWAILNPEKVHTEKMKDPDYRRHYLEVVENMVRERAEAGRIGE